MFTRILTSTLLFLIAIGGFVANVDFRNDDSNLGLSRISYNIANEAYADIATDKGCDPGQTMGTNGVCSSAGGESADIKKMYNSLVAGLNIVLAALSFIVMPAIILASWLMSPDWTSGDAFGLRDVMHDIWIIVSNIIYFVYAILLIMIALGTIFGKDSFSYQKMLPKLALGILMVPFTWWFVQWTISLSTIMTASVISIPQEVMDGLPQKEGSFWTTPLIPKDVTISTISKEGVKDSTSKEKCKPTDNDNCISPKLFFKNAGGIWSPLVVYGYGIFKFQEVKKLEKWTDGLTVVGQLVHQGILAVVMFLVFGILVIALIFILVTRAIKLWVYAMFSPLFTLHFVAGKEIMGKMGDSEDTFSIKEFIGLCFVPAVIALTLSFGLIVISAVITPNNKEQAPNATFTMFGNSNSKISSSADGKNTLVEFGGMKMTFEGGIGGSGGAAAGENLSSIFGKIGSFFGTIIVDIIALIFIWTAFMAAKGVNKAVSKAIDPFEKMGKSIGGLATKLPQYAPIPGLGGMSVAGLGKSVDKVQTNIESSHNDRIAKSDLGKYLGMEASVGKDVKAAVDNLKIDANKTAVADAHAKLKNETTQNRLDQTTQAINNLAGKLGVVDKDGKWTGKDSELAEALTGFGMDRNTDAAKIIEQIKANKGVISSQYFKSGAGDDIYKKMYGVSAGAASGGAKTASETTPGNAASSGFTSNPTVDGAGKTGAKVTMGDTTINIFDKKISDDDRKKIVAEFKGKLTEAEFIKKLEALTPDIQEMIKKIAKDESGFYKN